MLGHEVIRASAGSGKTFALSNRFLQLVLQEAPPGSILATTFTRKAAGEILARVLTRAAQAALDTKGARKFADAMHDPRLTLPLCRTLLSTLANQLHTLTVSTLDSFFARTSQCFRFELGLPIEPVLADEGDPLALMLRQQAVHELLTNSAPDLLRDLLRRVHHDASIKSVAGSIDDLASELHTLFLAAPDAKLWTQLKPPHEPLDEPALRQVSDSLRALLDQGGLNIPLTKALTKDLGSLAAHDWKALINGGPVKSLLEGKTKFGSATLTPTLLDAYQPLARHAHAAVIQQYAHEAAATHELLTQFDHHFTRLKEKWRLLFFSDLPRTLAAWLHDEESVDITDVLFRLDARIQHVLLDEFQDTSVEQWNVLQPFAEEIASYADGTRTLFCVGDVKQAIYGWRGGCAEIFAHIETGLGLERLQRGTLDKSYRSAPVVLDAVNQTFGNLAGNPALTKYAPLAAQWADQFRPHDTVHTKLTGYVELITSQHPRADTDHDDEDEIGGDDHAPTDHLAFTARKIAQWWETARTRNLSLGVLVRTNRAVGALIHQLTLLGIPASGEGGKPLTDEPGVGIILAALRLADHPGDTLALAHVQHSPLATHLFPVLDTAVSTVARHIRRQLITRGYASVIMDWARHLAPWCDARGTVRLWQLVDLADRFSPHAGLRPMDFVDYVTAIPVEEPTPAPVRIMTVFKAKGLEFDIVVLPELHAALDGRQRGIFLPERASPTAPIRAVYPAADKTVRQLCPPLQQAFAQWEATRIRDDLCVLYVAMTRARRAVHMIIPPLQPKIDGTPKAQGWTRPSYAAILRRQLSTQAAPDFAGEQTLFSAGDPNWSNALPTVAIASTEPVPPVQTSALQTKDSALKATPRTRSWRWVSPSAEEADSQVSAKDLLSLRATPQRRKGSILHAWFEQVEWADADVGVPDDATLFAAAQKVDADLPAELRAEWLAEFRGMLAKDAIRAALAKPDFRGDPGARLEIWRERPFIAKVDERMVRGTFDRVVIHFQNDQPVFAQIIDFKTDRPAADDPRMLRLVEHYRPQVRSYVGALCHMLGLEKSQVEAVLLFVTAGIAHKIVP